MSNDKPKPISELTEQALQKPSTTHISNTPKPMAANWVAAIFSRLQARYGHKWSTSHGTEELARLAMTEWADGLTGLSGEQVQRGLQQWQEPWPPSLPEFRNACKYGDVDDEHNTAAYKSFPPGLPKPKAKPGTVEREMKRMRIKPHMTPEEIDLELAKLRKAGL